MSSLRIITVNTNDRIFLVKKSIQLNVYFCCKSSTNVLYFNRNIARNISAIRTKNRLEWSIPLGNRQFFIKRKGRNIKEKEQNWLTFERTGLKSLRRVYQWLCLAIAQIKKRFPMSYKAIVRKYCIRDCLKNNINIKLEIFD
jgi:hypothetical protein